MTLFTFLKHSENVIYHRSLSVQTLLGTGGQKTLKLHTDKTEVLVVAPDKVAPMIV